jgi:uncharacterized membrane protein YvbJ
MKTCSDCGEKNNDNDTRFCMSCGSDLNKPELSQNNKTKSHFHLGAALNIYAAQVA